MKKIIVIGCPGSGKSTISWALHNKTGIPLYHLDMMFWNANKTTVEKSVFLERLSAVLERDEWIIDGNYGSTMELRMAACDTVIFLDYPLDVCLDGIRERRGKPRSDMPWIDTELDPWLKGEIEEFGTKNLPTLYDLLDKYKDGRDIVIFKSREESERFLNELKLSER